MSIYRRKSRVSRVAMIAAISGVILSLDAKTTNILTDNAFAQECNSNSDGWVKENSKWYYYENDEKKTGWLNLSGTWYWLDSDGVMASNEWVKLNGTWYWLNPNGSMASNEWLNQDGTWYWVKSNGAMASKEWVKQDGKWYWLNPNGTMASNGWLKVDNEWYWLNPNGSMVSNEWIKLNNIWYWLNQNGTMASNELLEIKGVWYRFGSSGAMSTKTITKVGKVKECDYLNVRSGAGSSHSVVGKVYSNDHVEVLEEGSNGWYKVQTGNDITGWVSGNYITVVYNESNGATDNETIDKVVELAHKQLGKPYVWGAEGPNSFDCSGFTYYVYKNAAGITIPRVSRDQAKAGTHVSRSDLQPGDLVFFASSGTTINHVGLYIGDSKFIHSPQSGDVVKISSMSSGNYNKNFATARRFIK